MATKVTIDNFTTAITKELNAYSDEVQKAIDTEIPKVAKKGAKELQAASPKKTGKYAKGWAVQTEKGRLNTTATIYNKSKPGLAHLLENGHAKRSGGRVPAKVHIKPVEESVNTEVENAIKRAIS